VININFFSYYLLAPILHRFRDIFYKSNTILYLNISQIVFVAAVVKNNGISINYLKIVTIGYFFGEVTQSHGLSN